MRTLRDNAILLAILVFLFLAFREQMYLTTFIVVMYFWIKRTKDKSFIWIFLLLLGLSVPRYNTKLPDLHTAQAVKVSGKYSLLKSGNTKIIVYTKEPLKYDAIYSFEGNYTPVKKSSSFFCFDYARWCHDQGVYYSLKPSSIKLMKKYKTPRFILQERINQVVGADEKKILYKVLLNIRLRDVEEDSWLFSNGLSYSGILLFLQFALKYWIEDQKREKIILILNIIFCIIFCFPLLLVSSLIFRCLKFTKLQKYQQTGIGLVCLMICFPSCIFSLGFLIPSTFRLMVHITDTYKSWSLFLSFFIQSILFHKINLVQNFFFRFIQLLQGMFWLISLLYLFVPISGLNFFLVLLDGIQNCMKYFDIYGSAIGFGTIFYAALLFVIRKNKNFVVLAIFYLFLFQILGLFHPLAEVSVINVGQGDSILVRLPLNQGNILIDTGKESAWNALDSFLLGKGINKLDALVVTHDDSDHSGNKERVIEKYKPNQVVDFHKNYLQVRNLKLYDLNEICNEDKNQSSIVLFMELNRMRILLMGDADAITEEEILKKYPNLKVDILKLGHHGSKTSSSDDFLDSVRPELAFISAGPYSMYHHPSPEVIQKLLKRHIPYFHTLEDGDLSILSVGRVNLLLTSSGKVGILS